MRILVVNPYARGAGYSGPNVFMDRLFERVSGVHSITLAAGSRSANHRAWPEAVVVPAVFDPRSRWSQVRWAVFCGAWMFRNYRRYDVVHLQGVYLFNLSVALVLALRGRRFVLLPLAADGDLAVSSITSRRWLTRALRRFLVGRAAVGFALAPRIAEEFEYWGLASSRIHALGNAVDTDTCRPPKLDDRAGSRTLVFVGSLSRRKNPFVVADAIESLARRGHTDVRGTFVGPFVDAETRTVFQQQLERLKIADRIELVGYSSDVTPYLTNASVFVLPSDKEGLPGALVEAMAAGLPVVVTEAGSMGDVVRDAGCGFVMPAEGDSIAAAVAELWASPVTWSEFSARSRDYAVNHFSIDVVAERYKSAIETIGTR